ncbi:Nn.00g010230.m01.CDS01 [Neocucurbitaria sp. VM-36]
MQLSRLLFRIALICAPVALISTAWLYLYPVLHRGCAFPTPPTTNAHATAPFRLLALGDPQLEGDSSLPDPNARVFASVEFLVPHLRNATSLDERRSIVVEATKGIVKDAARWLEGKRKAIDLWGNDWYLAHIVRSLRWWTEPTHVSVLGDLLGSQWVTDGEFERRAGRYWNIVMRGLEKVPDNYFGVQEIGQQADPPEETVHEEAGRAEEGVEGEQNKSTRKPTWGGTTEVLGTDKNWDKRVINIAGNHDVGYAGDIDQSRIERFEKAFGSVNWDIWFTLPDHNASDTTTEASTDPPPALRLVILNSMNIDTPAWSSDLQTETYSFMNHIITNSRPVNDKTHATVLLTHIPLEKESGICIDSPYFDFFDGGHGVKEQNMLSDHASKIVLEGIFGLSGNKDAAGRGLGRRGVVINGHDHAGCDVLHWIKQAGSEDGCRVEDIKREEAYWPVVIDTLNNSMLIPLADVDGINVDAASLNETEAGSSTNSEADETASSPETTEPTPDPPKPDTSPKWKARRFPPLQYDIDENNECTTIQKAPHIREITLRSMMGEFSGYAGFLSAWFDPSIGERGEWVFGFSTCGLGVQHWWWGIHIMDLSLIVLFLSAGVLQLVEAFQNGNESQLRDKGTQEQKNQANTKGGGNSRKDTKS